MTRRTLKARSEPGSGLFARTDPNRAERFVTTPTHRHHPETTGITITVMRRTLTTAAAAVLATLLLAGCSSNGPSAKEKEYADAVSIADPDDYGDMSTDGLAGALGDEGAQLCEQLKKGRYEDAVAYAKLGFSAKQSEALVAAAAVVYCPDQKSKLPAG